MRWYALCSLLLLVACDGGPGDGSGSRRGVGRAVKGGHDLSRPTPASGAPTRGALIVESPEGDVHIGKKELVDCPEEGCLLSDIVTLPATQAWCVNEPGKAPETLSTDSLAKARVLARTKGGVKIVAPGERAPLVRSPARVAPCP